MIRINDLRVCKACGNVFSTKAGVTNILECPQCKQSNFDRIDINYEELT
ncbi:MAG: hypothetical protein OES34_08145 [Nitrosopumilus sp.]|nr:hypothetical protein [Nitrosopumilus sp.]